MFLTDILQVSFSNHLKVQKKKLLTSLVFKPGQFFACLMMFFFFNAHFPLMQSKRVLVMLFKLNKRCKGCEKGCETALSYAQLMLINRSSGKVGQQKTVENPYLHLKIL